MFSIYVYGEIDRYSDLLGKYNMNSVDRQKLIDLIGHDLVIYKKDHSVLFLEDDKIIAIFEKQDEVIKDLEHISWKSGNVYNLPSSGNDIFYKVKCTIL